ncbi:ribbon-helix-helix domain-containing protein [Tistrella mobilis]|uniref:ribbon-helix-helix domain-containing protein n=1 Tax=Tistrella mobilis TaxID=171437 RepID=UPI0035568D16
MAAPLPPDPLDDDPPQDLMLPPLEAAVEKRSVSIQGHRTSVSLEAPFWRVLKRAARARGISLGALVAAIDAARRVDRVNLSSALRLFALAEAESRAAVALSDPEATLRGPSEDPSDQL